MLHKAKDSRIIDQDDSYLHPKEWRIMKFFILSSLVSSLFIGFLWNSTGFKQIVRGLTVIDDVNDLPQIDYSIRYHTRAHPAVKPLDPHYRSSTSMSAKFRSLSPTPVQIWWDDNQGGIENGHLQLGQESTTNTYEGHVFFFTDATDKSRVLARHVMRSDQVLYTIEDPLYPAPAELKSYTDQEEAFMADYFNRTGLQWRQYYGPDGPRPPPKLFMWPAKQIGEVHLIVSQHSFWHCTGTKEQCQSKEPVRLELEVISLKPRAFVIKNFFSDFEADHIIRMAAPSMKHSSVGDTETGAFESDTRTSSNTWLSRSTSPIIESLFRRAADLLQIDHHHLQRKTGAEDLQVVNYKVGQRYDSHHDWGVSGYPESRFLTLLLYLNNQVNDHAGGETSFPKSEGGPIKVHPGKGSSVLFYDLLEDGNGDDLSLHASLPVLAGEKWLANFWVWDPVFHHG